MEKVKGQLTVFFEDPFWVGVFEKIDKGKLSVCKVTFGSEPKDYEVWEFILQNYFKLKFSPPIEVSTKRESKNPKRRQREARKQLEVTRIGTKSQQALQLQREQSKLERRAISKQEIEAEKQRKYALKKQKRKDKHKGR